MSFDPFTAGFDLIKTGLDKFFPDADTELKGKLDQAATQIANEYALTIGQLKINEVEAANPSFFVAGARPAAMWVGVASLFYNGIGVSILRICGIDAPVINDSIANDILIGLLGLGGMRTVEKVKGVQTRGIR